MMVYGSIRIDTVTAKGRRGRGAVIKGTLVGRRSGIWICTHLIVRVEESSPVLKLFNWSRYHVLILYPAQLTSV